MLRPQRKSSWSFSLRDDEWSSDESQGDQKRAQLQPVAQPARQEEDSLIREVEQESALEAPAAEPFDISLVEEGDVRFVETPFTIARRVAMTRKRAHGENDAEQEEAPLAPAPSRKEIVKVVPAASTSTHQKESASPATSLAQPKPVTSLGPAQSGSSAPRPHASTLSDRVLPSQAVSGPPCEASHRLSVVGPTLSHQSPSHLATVTAVSLFASPSLLPSIVSPVQSLQSIAGSPDQLNSGSSADDAEAGLPVSDEARWDVYKDGSTASTVTTSPPLSSPLHRSSQTPARSSFASSADGLRPVSPVRKSVKRALRSSANQHTSGPSDSPDSTTSTSSVKSESGRVCSQLQPSEEQGVQEAIHVEADLPQFGCYSLKPAYSSPSRTRPSALPRPSQHPATTTTNATWSTLSSRSRPSLIPKQSAYGSAVDGIASTSSAAARFALPEFASQGGGVAVCTGKRAPFKPTESLAAFKQRMERQRHGQSQRAESEVAEEEREHLVLGNLRSIRPGTVVTIGKSATEDQEKGDGGDRGLYRDLGW